MCGTFLRGNREVPRLPTVDGMAGRIGKASSRTPMTNSRGKSDRPVVPEKSPNNAGQPVAEAMEGRGLAKGNTDEHAASRTQSRTKGALDGLARVREAAKRDSKMKFTALLHHITPERLLAAFLSLKRTAAAGVDGVTWATYRESLEGNLRDLHERIHRGAYRASPSRRAYIPKTDGRLRPLGIAALEDKVVQRAMVEVLNAIYEEDFLGFSYGFRPGRGQHNALDALAVGIQRKKVGWVLDADIRGFFDAIDHGWMMKFVGHRVGDKRVLRLVQQWLKAGVLEEGKWTETKAGTPQGATASPLLANVYLHYALDLWSQQWRNRNVSGDVIIVRYADDFILGFQRQQDAERFLAELRERLRKFGLELHPDKTRLIRFGKFAAEQRRERGEGKPETFDFLGFTHICGKARNGKFLLRRHTCTARMRVTLRAIGEQLRQRRHRPIPEQGHWLNQVMRGYYAYHAVPTNIDRLDSFRSQAIRHWRKALCRRSQRARLPWERMSSLANRWVPYARTMHPLPSERFDVRTQGKSPVR